ncbi:MAG: hypothetical protein LBR46_00985 [Prevotella sp.]|jgi:hypothetical protein|nr:hypothetical protein [Prevotella sp.]
MKSVIYCLYTILFLFFIASCSDNVKLYHPIEEPEVKWLLKTVDYPEENPGFTTRYSQTFFYTDDEQVTKITNPSTTDSLLKMDYKPSKISLSRITKSSSTTTYDSLILKLNDKMQTEYALHVTYRQQEGKDKTKSNDDSTTFVYDAAGYLIQFDRYSYTGNNSSLSHTETHTIVDGNITEINIISGRTSYKYTYTYDDKEHAIPAEYCYEMPLNVSGLSGCWLFTNMPFLSEYFGKRNKNNVIHMTGERIINEAITPYGDISYKYTFDENNLVTQVEMSGISRSETKFENFTTSFSYYKKEIYW